MKLPQKNITEINRERKRLMDKIRLNLDKLEMLDKQEKEYRERKKILNLKQNQSRKEKRKRLKKEKEDNKYF